MLYKNDDFLTQGTTDIYKAIILLLANSYNIIITKLAAKRTF